MIETAKAFTAGDASFYDPAEYDLFVQRYGSMAQLQTMGNLPAEKTPWRKSRRDVIWVRAIVL